MLYDATHSGNNIVGEITSLGEIETTSNELLISFKSDCDVTNKGFQAVVEFVEKSSESNESLETISTPHYTPEYKEITTAKTTKNYPITTTILGQTTDRTGIKLNGKGLLIITINLNKVIFALTIELI